MKTKLIEQFVDILGPEGVLEDAFDMAPFLEDWRGNSKGDAYCVVSPSSVQQVSDVLRLANELGCPIYLQGGNTGLCHGAVPSKSGHCIVLSLSKMSAIRSLDRLSNCVVVDAGVILERVHAAVAEVGRSFPLHLGSEGTAQVGGLIATNAGGTNALRYGTMRDLVYGLEYVLPSGQIISDLEPLRKNNTGYDIKHLQIGGEGTLGVVTGASLKLHPASMSDAHAWLAFSVPADAVAFLADLQDRFDTSIIAYELLSKSQVDLVLKHLPTTRQPFEESPLWTVMIELGNPNPKAELKSALEEFLAEKFDSRNIVDAVVAQNNGQAADFWQVRHSVSEANKLEGQGLTHDIAVSVSKVPAFLSDAEEILIQYFPHCYPVVTCHLGDGNIHYIAMYSSDVWESQTGQEQIIENIQTRIHDLAISYEGTFSAEHGIGRKLTTELARLTPSAKLDIMRSLKTVLDPKNILNPGILFNTDQ